MADRMIWGVLLHLGYNFWNDEKAADFVRCDDAVWHQVTDRMAERRLNLLLIDLGEGVIYPSHPELAVNGSWSAEKLRGELERLRGMGIEPIPKLNFSAYHRFEDIFRLPLLINKLNPAIDSYNALRDSAAEKLQELSEAIGYMTETLRNIFTFR